MKNKILELVNKSLPVALSWHTKADRSQPNPRAKLNSIAGNTGFSVLIIGSGMLHSWAN